METQSRTFELPPRCNMKTITIRETTGLDEEKASALADGKEGGSLFQELIQLSITEIDGKPFDPISMRMLTWTTRTRKCVAMCFEQVNDVTEDETVPLLKGAVEPPLSIEPSQKSGKLSVG